MGTAYRYIQAAGLIVTIWDGQVTAAGLTDFARHQVNDSIWSHCRKRITDARTADTSSITDDDARTISAIYERANADTGSVKLAIVTNQSREIAQWADHSLQTHVVTTIVFNDVNIASAWLSVDADMVFATIRHLRQELRDPR